jgi:outer membrane immunogenic protein
MIKMRKSFLVATAASVLAFTASGEAADVGTSTYDWTGFYAGLNAGVAWNNSDITQQYNNDLYECGSDRIAACAANGRGYDRVEDKIEGDQAAFTGGAMLGYNWQMDRVVFGVEADINYLGFSEETERSREGIVPSVPSGERTSKLSFEADWFGTVRGRLGYAANNLLFYGTGGLAYGHMDASGKVTGAAPVLNSVDVETASYHDDLKGSASSTNFGWTIGAGMEYGLDRWSLGVEYLFVDLGTAEWDSDASAPAVASYHDTDYKGSVDYQFSVVRATAKLRF